LTTHEDLYRIGTVAKLTGITVECLRAWERRYGLGPKRRTGKTRFYSPEQIEKLKKLKALVELGHPIGSLVELSDDQLEARVTRAPTIRPHRLPQLGIVGPNLVILEQESVESDQVEVCFRWVDLEDFLQSRPTERAALDVVAVQFPSLNPDAIERARRAVPDCRLIAVYQFASPNAIVQAQARGIRALAWPVTWEELARECASPAGTPMRAGKAAPRRFTDRELVAIASQALRNGEETPRHLVNLVTQLNAFADYATQSILERPDDAELHDQIREEASYARAQLERALALAAEAWRIVA